MPDLSVDPGGLVGKVLSGRYRVTRVIAEGGMGVVYEAEQKMGDNVRKLAVKALLPALSQDPSIVKRFHRESGLVAQLEHPNTIRLYDFGTTPDGRLYIAMELVEGRPLTNDIEAGPIPMDRALRILKQICGALAEAHHLGIVHRDLKPDNVILTDRAGEQDFVKLLDFGIAKRTGDVGDHRTKITQAGMVLGTPPYMSPEQLAGEEVDARSDVYSLGVLAYEIVTGRLPFEADSPWEWASKHMTAAPLPPRTVTDAPIPERVEAAILHALAKRREDRPQDVLSFLAELSGAVQRISAPKTQMAPVLAPIRTESAVAAPLPPPAPRASRLGWVLASFGVL
ncbi:MAG TPA: serine/threonine-protein kinase, partial [Polyangiaceae bacterium]|nr:serine/threonine-protein kinase [Polyangiaceae bacterium]